MNDNFLAPKPPSLHWAIVLVLSVFTLGLFGCFWMFRQAIFVRKIDPANRAVLQVFVSVALFLFSLLMNAIVLLTVSRGGVATDLGSVMTMMKFFQFLMIITAYTEMRKALNKHYGLHLNAFLAVIFNVFYLQYHLTKIAKAQEAGTLLAGDMLPSSQARSASA